MALNIYTNDPDLGNRRDQLTIQLETAKNECDWRSIGGYNNLDERFAFEMREAIQNVLKFLDDEEECAEEIINNLTAEIRELEGELGDAQSQLNRIEEIATPHRELRDIMDIIGRNP
jgi:hypothetical protein